MLRPELLDEFKFSKANLLGQAVKYMQALRSILLAHPLETDRHPKYGFDGDFISVDMGFPKSPLIMIAAENFLKPKCSKLSLDGMQRNEMVDDCDYSIVGYRKSEGARFSQYVGCNISDLVIVVDLVKEYMNELKV